MVDKNGNGLNKKGILLVIALATLLVIGGISFAYTWADKLTNEPLDVLASTATLKLRYNDCANEDVSTCGDITADLAPGESISKTFEVKNVGTLDATYDIYFRELENTFKNSDLVYTLEDLTNDKVIVSERVIPMGTKNNILIKRDLLSPVGSTVRYKLTVTFLNREYDQSENMDAEFSLKLKIGELQSTAKSMMMSRIVGEGDDMSLSEEGLWSHYENVEKIVFEDSLTPKENAAYVYDMSNSSSEPESVMAYLVPSESNSENYIAYIQGEGGVKAPVNSMYLFAIFSNLNSIENLEYLDTSDVTDMNNMFSGSGLITLDLSNFDTSNVTNMSYMFNQNNNLKYLDLGNFDTKHVINMTRMFNLCEKLISLDLSCFDTGNVTDMTAMFYNCISLESLNLNNFDFSHLTSLSAFFAGLSKLTTLNLNNVNTKNITDMSSMFNSCTNLKTLDLSSFDTSDVTNMMTMFVYCSSLTSLDLSSFDTSKVTSMESMFGLCNNLEFLNLSGFDFSNLTSMQAFFENMPKLITLKLDNANTSNITDMSYMFANCPNLTTLDLSSFDTSKVTNMEYMFDGCNSLIDLNIKNWNINANTSSYVFHAIPSTIKISVSNSAMGEWVISHSVNPRLTTANIVI